MMIVLDTNIVSELMRKAPNPKVIDWIRCHEISDLAITVIALAEISRGIARLPKGKRREQLVEKFQDFIKYGFGRRILPFDEASARIYGALCFQREKMGRGVDPIDVIIMSIVKMHGAVLATRNVKDFEGWGIEIVNPWE